VEEHSAGREDFHAGDLLANAELRSSGPDWRSRVERAVSSKDFQTTAVAIISPGTSWSTSTTSTRWSHSGDLSSNSYTLDALTRVAGGLPVDLESPPTPGHRSRESSKRADCDLILTSAGVSSASRLHARCLRGAGASRDLEIRCDPPPLAFGMLDDVRARVSGNPVSQW